MILNDKKETTWKKAILPLFECLIDPKFTF